MFANSSRSFLRNFAATSAYNTQSHTHIDMQPLSRRQWDDTHTAFDPLIDDSHTGRRRVDVPAGLETVSSVTYSRSFVMYSISMWAIVFLADRTYGRAYATVLRLSVHCLSVKYVL